MSDTVCWYSAPFPLFICITRERVLENLTLQTLFPLGFQWCEWKALVGDEKTEERGDPTCRANPSFANSTGGSPATSWSLVYLFFSPPVLLYATLCIQSSLPKIFRVVSAFLSGHWLSECFWFRQMFSCLLHHDYCMCSKEVSKILLGINSILFWGTRDYLGYSHCQFWQYSHQ